MRFALQDCLCEMPESSWGSRTNESSSSPSDRAKRLQHCPANAAFSSEDDA